MSRERERCTLVFFKRERESCEGLWEEGTRGYMGRGLWVRGFCEAQWVSKRGFKSGFLEGSTGMLVFGKVGALPDVKSLFCPFLRLLRLLLFLRENKS